MKEYSKILLAVIITFGVSISAQSLIASWVEPPANPPLSNPTKPINVSMDYQAKAGSMGIGGNLSVAGKINMASTANSDGPNTVVTKQWFLNKMPAYVEVYYSTTGHVWCPSGFKTIGARTTSGVLGFPSSGYLMCLKIN